MTDQKYMKPGFDFATGKLNEELGESVAAIGKSMRFGWFSYDPTVDINKRRSNIDWLLSELDDLKGAIKNFEDQVCYKNLDNSVFNKGLN
jgi:hypothetical protein